MGMVYGVCVCMGMGMVNDVSVYVDIVDDILCAHVWERCLV